MLSGSCPRQSIPTDWAVLFTAIEAMVALWRFVLPEPSRGHLQLGITAQNNDVVNASRFTRQMQNDPLSRRHAMDEVFPVLAGVAVGLLSALVKSMSSKVILIGLMGLVFGVSASWISGELSISWTYLVVDALQVIGAAAMTALLVRIWHRRGARLLVR
jgi:hypothetical protein